ncbi:MAG: cytochrome b N-terminal domain-containing protein [Gemmatimonadales bacterium]
MPEHLRVEDAVEAPPHPAPTPSPARAGGALQERLAWDALEYRIAPVANRLPYMLGGLTFFGILVLISTGILLDQFYNPSPVGAHDSILYIMTRVPLGSWVRGLHYWAAAVVLVSMILHLIYVFWRRSYLRPRELTWWAGVLLFITLFGLVFTGTVLRADQEGSEALAHAVAGARLVGPLGSLLTPDFTRSVPLLARMHNAHVSLLPLLLLGLVGLHFWLIRYLGIRAHEPRTVLFTTHLRRLTGYGLVLLAFLGGLAAFATPGIGYPGIEGAEVTKPFWPFLWIYTVENTMGLWGMILAPLVLFGFLFLVPLLDRPRDEHAGRPRWLLGLAVLMLALYVGGIVYGVFAPQMQHIGM